MKRIAIFTALCAIAAGAGLPAASAQPVPWETPARPNQIPLRDAAPGAQPEQWHTNRSGTHAVRNVAAPTLEPFLPDPAKATGVAVIVAPGGGFTTLEMDNEGYPVARWLADRGIAAFVLKYRLTQTPRDHQAFLDYLRVQNTPPPATSVPAPRPAAFTISPERQKAFDAAREDGQAAVRLVRARAAEWKIDPAKVGMVGFSAGAYTTMAVALADDRPARPDFIAPIYGSMAAREVPADAPPMFLAVAFDDPLMMRDAGFGIIESWRAAKRPVEAHFYERGGHGFGMMNKGVASALWIDQFLAWMQDRQIVPKAKR
ncbi:MAG: alpha/beta hydrolase [Novosphingobium sp.]